MQFFLLFEPDKEAKTDTRKMIYFEMIGLINEGQKHCTH